MSVCTHSGPWYSISCVVPPLSLPSSSLPTYSPFIPSSQLTASPSFILIILSIILSTHTLMFLHHIVDSSLACNSDVTLLQGVHHYGIGPGTIPIRVAICVTMQKMFQWLHCDVGIKKMLPEISRVYHFNLFPHCLSFMLVKGASLKKMFW